MLKCNTPDDADGCKCPNEWQSYMSDSVKTFNLKCPTREQAEFIAGEMKAHPKHFKSTFEMDFELSTRQTGK